MMQKWRIFKYILIAISALTALTFFGVTKHLFPEFALGSSISGISVNLILMIINGISLYILFKQL